VCERHSRQHCLALVTNVSFTKGTHLHKAKMVKGLSMITQ
jgi:hypothetical protein